MMPKALSAPINNPVRSEGKNRLAKDPPAVVTAVSRYCGYHPAERDTVEEFAIGRMGQFLLFLVVFVRQSRGPLLIVEVAYELEMIEAAASHLVQHHRAILAGSPLDIFVISFRRVWLQKVEKTKLAIVGQRAVFLPRRPM